MANSYYADLDGTTFPDAIDSWEKFLDPTASSQAAINSYYNCINNGDFSGAATVLEQNPRLNQMIINAKRMNQIRDAVISLERFFDDTVYAYIADLTKDMGTWAVNTTYKKYSVVDYNIGGANLYFIAIKDVPKNVSPTNTTYWKSMTIKGDKGDSGLGLVPRGSWSNTIQYSQYDFVAYNNSLWYATEDNINDTPTETSDSWVLLMSISDIYSEDMLITLPKDRWGEVDGVYVNTISAQSSTSDMQPIYGLVPAGEKAIENEIEAYSHIYALVCGDGYINVYSDEPLDITLSLILKNCMIKSAGFSPNDYAALVQNVERIDGDVESNKQEVDAKFKEIDEGIGKTVEDLEDKIKEIDEGIGKTVEDLEDKISKAVSNVDTVLSYTSINPVQNRVITAELNKKVSSVDGMGLSHNDFTDEYKDKINKNLPLTNGGRIYVDGTNGSDSTGNGTSTNPYKSINYAISTIPKNLNGHYEYIMITGGTYNEEVEISGFCNGYLYITKNGSGNVIVKELSISYCFGCIIAVSNFRVLANSYGTSEANIYCATAVELSNITLDNVTYGGAGFYCRHCDVRLSSCVVSGGNGTAVLAADNGKILVSSMSGSCTGSGGTGVGFQAGTGGQICIGSSSLTATTLYKTSEGGRIYTGAQKSTPNY